MLESSPKAESLEEKISALKARIEELEGEKNTPGNSMYSQSVEAKAEIDLEIADLIGEVDKLESEKNGKKRSISEEVNDLNKDLENLVAEHEEMSVSLRDLIAQVQSREQNQINPSPANTNNPTPIFPPTFTPETPTENKEVTIPSEPKKEEPPKVAKSIEPPKPKAKRKLGVVETDLAEKRARDVAAERMTRNKDELKGIGGFFKKIWTHNWMAEYYRAKEVEKIRREMNEVSSTQGTTDTNAVGDKKIKGAILERFLKDVPGMVHETAGEWKDDLEHLNPEQRAAAERGIREAIVAYVSTADADTAEGNLTEAINREYANVFCNSNGKKGFEPLNIADNIKEYAREMRGQVEHGVSIANLDLDFELTFGKAVTGARTEASYTWRDKMIEKMSKSPIGRFVNETTIAASVCAAASIAQTVTRWSVRASVGAFGGGLVMGGALAAQRESQAIKRDRAEHARATAQGRTFNTENSPRRKEINETVYNMLPARTAIDNLRNISDGIENPSGTAVSDQQVIDLIGLLGSVDSKINLSDREKIDLLSYSDEQNVEVERTELDIERARARVIAKEAYERSGMATRLGSFETYCGTVLGAAENSVIKGEGGIEARDKNFNALKRRRVAGAFVKGAAVAGVAGTVFREVIHMGQDVHEQIADTPGAGIRPHSWLGTLLFKDPNIPAETQTIPGFLETHNVTTGGVHYEVTNNSSAVMKLPEGFHFIPGSNPNEFQIMQGGHFDSHGHIVGGKIVADHIGFDKGTPGHPGSYRLNQASEDVLRKAGLNPTSHLDSSRQVSNFDHSYTKNLTSHEYASEHPQEFQRVHRMGWADNHTRKPDLNELRLRDPIIGKDGKIHISLKGMTHHGSTMGHKHLDVPDLVHKGRVELWISASQDTQFTPAHIPVGPDGTAVIDPNSAVGRLFKFDSHGHVIDRPRFTEAAAIMGSHNGVKDAIICATDEGKNLHHISTNVIDRGVKEIISNRMITDVDYQEPDLGPDLPMPIPFFIPRGPLERLNRRRKEGTLDYGYNGFYKMRRKEYEERMSQEIKDNPEAELNEDKEVLDYLNRQEKNYKVDLDQLAGEAGPMDPKCETSICIPVAGHQEGKNIYKTLENYLNQTANKDSFELVLFVNRPDKDKDGKEILSDETLNEINRFKTDHPELRVVVMNKIIPYEKAKIGYIRKLLNDSVLLRQKNRGKTNTSHIIISNDSDNKGVASEYVENFQKKFKANPDTDAFMGQLDWDPESYVRNPLIHIGTRLFQFVDVQLKHGDSNNIASSGANFAFRSGMYAAVNGYSNNLDLAEDVDLGRAIKAARIGSKKKLAIGFAGARVSRLFTSSRRAEKAIKDGLSPVEQWNKGFSAFDDEVRKFDWEKLSKDIDFDKSEDTAQLIDGIEKIINRTMKAMNWVKEDDKIFYRALGWMGIKFTVVGKKEIKISDAEGLIAGLKEYKTNVVDLMKKKTKKK